MILRKQYSLLIHSLILIVSACVIALIVASIPVNAQLYSNQQPIGTSPSTTIGEQTLIRMEPVKLDGRTLFMIAGMGSNDGKETASLDNRVDFIEDALYKFLKEDFNVESLRVEVHDKGDHTKIVASDNGNFKDVPLFILTPLDARVAGFTLAESSNYIATATEKALKKGWQERQTNYLEKQVKFSIILVLIGLFVSSIIWLWQHKIKQREAILREQKMECDRKITENTMSVEMDEDEEHSSGFCQKLATEQLHNRQMLDRKGLQRYLLQVTQGAIWIGIIAWILELFPYTRAWRGTVLQLPLLFGVLLLAIAAAKWSGILVDRTLEKWLRYRQNLSPEAIERWLLRANSFAPIIKSIMATLIIIIAVLFVLSQLGIPLTPILAGAGILSLAISLGSQRLIADLISGTLILIEDQYAIGDFVTLNDNSFGRVERLNLRSTALRNRQGNLITLSNSDIKQVNNLSKDWARSKLYIPVHFSANVDIAIKVLEQVIEDMKADDFWNSLIQEAEVRGVEDIDGYGFTVGVRFQTKPGIFRKVIREYRRRLKPAFDQANIRFAERPVYQSGQVNN